ncbi:hypothetical protein OOT33_13885 [Sphingobium sp. DEHP117]|uniref:hypothetical protein n=1 Tax=Sphingobium sp. DEHP117 TaxID=2993436 RepID=UPI0027D6AFA0|nr:hypothetical protein [Sphingobium sp. DEHP117]MDQ4421513.1 hypothetical protein [Sphingobium sp. DEHP117]
MAFCDYHACDNCGERKTFYDADHNITCADGDWLYDYNAPTYPGYRVYALCHECAKTHRIAILPTTPGAPL